MQLFGADPSESPYLKQRADYSGFLDEDEQSQLQLEDNLRLRELLAASEEEKENLLNQIEKLSQERDDLLSTCNSLGERNRRSDDKLNQLAMMHEQDKAELRAKIASLEEDVARSSKVNKSI